MHSDLSALSSFFPGLTLDNVRLIHETLILQAHRAALQACCPTCHQPSLRVHSRYLRTPRDLPISNHKVRLLLSVRRFFCDTVNCPQRTFAEQLPEFLPRCAQRTIRLTQSLLDVVNALGGKAGARLADKLHMGMSHDTLLRIIRSAKAPAPLTPHVLGVDDFALRKGRYYGTLLVDLQERQPIDLLPDRSALTLANWLQAHPGVEVVARDRSPEYARGITLGAPLARQVADRWHLLKNLGEAVERMFQRIRADLVRLSPPRAADSQDLLSHTTVAQTSLRRPSPAERLAHERDRTRRLAHYLKVRQLAEQGVPLLQIARRLGLARGTVRKYASAPAFPERATHPVQPSIIDPYAPYLQRRLEAGCQNASQLWREIQADGYRGTYQQVARWLHLRRVAPAASMPKQSVFRGGMTNASAEGTAKLPSARQLTWLLLRPSSEHTTVESVIYSQIYQDATVRHVQALVQQFQKMIRERAPEALVVWMAACEQSGIIELQTFAAGLAQEEASIRAALSEVWSTGQVEGQITRLKLLKRQMYGRAKFDLLRQRVLQRS
jgi:transposase